MTKITTFAKSIRRTTVESGTLCNVNIEAVQEAQSNNSIPNIAIELLPKSEAFTKSPHSQAMASYNDSNRVPGHETRWNSK